MEIVKQVFEGQELVVFEESGELWFRASEIAKLLGYRNGPDMTRRLDEDEKGTRSVRTPGGTQDVTVINEPGVYRAIFASRKEEAERFKRWLAHDLLPTLRRTGFYSLREPVITAAGIARAYSRPASTIPVWIQHYQLVPVGYAENPETGKPVHVYRVSDVEVAFQYGHSQGMIPLRAYSGAWEEGPIPPEKLPVSRKELNRRYREARDQAPRRNSIA